MPASLVRCFSPATTVQLYVSHIMSTVHLPLRANLHDAISACFLGPRAENFNILEELFHGALAEHAKTRLEYNPGDGVGVAKSFYSALCRSRMNTFRTSLLRR